MQAPFLRVVTLICKLAGESCCKNVRLHAYRYSQCYEKIVYTKKTNMTATELNFRPIRRNKACFFSIAETPVLYEDPIRKGSYRHYPDKKIIINNDINEGISIVKNGFLSVRHEEAFNLGITIFEFL